MSKQKNYLIGGAAAADEYINLEIYMKMGKRARLSTAQTKMFKDKLVGKLKIPDNIYELEHRAFKDTNGITEVILPTGFKILATRAFADCTNLKKVFIPNTIEQFKNYIFSGCTSLHTVVLPSQKLDIRKGVFNNCPALATIIFSGERFNSFRDAADMACHRFLPLTSTRTAEWTEMHNGYQITCRGVWRPRNRDPQAPNETFLIGLDQQILINTLGGDEYPVEFPPGEPLSTKDLAENGFPDPPPIDLRKLLLQTYPKELGPEPGTWSIENPLGNDSVPTLNGAEIIQAIRTRPDKPLLLVWDEEPEGEVEVQGLDVKNIKRKGSAKKKPKKKETAKISMPVKTRKKGKKGSKNKQPKPTKKKGSKKK